MAFPPPKLEIKVGRFGKKLAGWGKSWQVCKNSWQVGKKVGRLGKKLAGWVILKFEVCNYLKAVRLRKLVFGKGTKTCENFEINISY